MTNQEILTKAIQKAIDGGWQEAEYKPCGTHDYNPQIWFDDDGVNLGFEAQCDKSMAGNDMWGRAWKENELIFNHDFAKALWGEDWACEWHGHPVGDGDLFCRRDDGKGTVTSICGAAKSVVLQVWQYHLQQMVIADDPIKYLGDNLSAREDIY